MISRGTEIPDAAQASASSVRTLRVGDAVAAAEVEFGQDQAVLFVQAGHQSHDPPYSGQIRLDAGDLGAQVAVQAGEFELRLSTETAASSPA